MEITIDRRAEVPGQKDLKFAVSVRSLDGHTHGELTRVDKAEVAAVLKLAADAVQEVLEGQEVQR